jgi:hypothetical protein
MKPNSKEGLWRKVEISEMDWCWEWRNHFERWELARGWVLAWQEAAA